MSYEFQIQQRDAQPAVTIRGNASMEELPAFFERAFGSTMAHIGQAGQHPSGPPFAIYRSQDPTNFDVEAGFPVATPVEGNGAVQASEIPACRACTTILRGPYEQLPEAWEAISRHTQQRGLESETWGYEIYLNDPMSVPADEIKTELVLPLK